MNCRMTSGVYLRANGEINCYCSTGEQITLSNLPLEDNSWNFVEDHYLQGKFTRIREAMTDNTVPFPSYCLKCNYLSPKEEYQPGLLQKEIEWAHIEAAAVCNLRCPFCVHGTPPEKKTWARSKPHFLPRSLYSKMLRDVHDAGMRFKWMYFSGRGEPTLHPEIWDMVAEAKSMFNTNFLVNTNGNVEYSDAIVDCGLDKIKIALDSTRQDIYERYRVGGKVSNIFELTRRIAKRKAEQGVSTPQIIWQRVLFDFNDSDKELLEYQELAREMGVDSIRFVFTYTKNHSKRRPKDLPLNFPAIDICDSMERDNIAPEKMRMALAQLKATPNIADATQLVLDLIHWFDLDVENREDYDIYSNLELYDEALFRSRQGHPNLAEYVAALKESLSILSKIYAEQGQKSLSELYLSYANKIGA